MKTFFALMLMFLVTVLLLLSSDFKSFNKEKYVDQKVLDISIPFSVKIDEELLNSLEPANE